MLIAKEFVEGLKLTKAKNLVIIEISCLEDVLNILQLLSLQLVRRVNHEFSEVVQLYSLAIRVEMELLLGVDLLNRDLLLFDLANENLLYQLGKTYYFEAVVYRGACQT